MLHRDRDLAKTTLVDAFLPFVFDCQRARADRAVLSLARRDARSHEGGIWWS